MEGTVKDLRYLWFQHGAERRAFSVLAGDCKAGAVYGTGTFLAW